jgi:hypothetical protein
VPQITIDINGKDSYDIYSAGWYYNQGEGFVPCSPPAFNLVKNTEYNFEKFNSVADSLFCQRKTADGWNKVTVDVPIPEEPILTELVVSENGVYENPVITSDPVIEIG